MREDLVKGYEYSTDRFLILSETELEMVRLVALESAGQQPGEAQTQAVLGLPTQSAHVGVGLPGGGPTPC